ncbi:MAG: hypothetical protein M1820_005548 [Bogoriella megaspora]|nr:MAG: hypothetical protein M1820_005548 [Bogoriella megaspora]
MMQTTTIFGLASLISLVSAHGFITDPAPRMPGTQMAAACGQQVYNNQKADNYGNIQGMLQVANTQTDYDAAKCNIWQCKGYKFEDNTANVHSFTAGQTVSMKFDVRAPHTGVANISIVDTATGKTIGDPLKSYTEFASTASGVKPDETGFSITIPSDIGSQCSTAGACVIQHYWNAADINQTYESCYDFTVGGSGSGSSAPAASSTAVTSAAAAATSTSSAAPAATSSASGQKCKRHHARDLSVEH